MLWNNLYNAISELWKKKEKEEKKDLFVIEDEEEEEFEAFEEEIPPLVVLEPSRDVLRPWRSETFLSK